MKFGHYIETTARNLRELNRRNGKDGHCDKCGQDGTLEIIYLGHICDEAGPCGILQRTRGYTVQCSACSCSYGEPFKIYFNSECDDFNGRPGLLKWLDGKEDER